MQLPSSTPTITLVTPTSFQTQAAGSVPLIESIIASLDWYSTIADLDHNEDDAPRGFVLITNRDYNRIGLFYTGAFGDRPVGFAKLNQIAQRSLTTGVLFPLTPSGVKMLVSCYQPLINDMDVEGGGQYPCWEAIEMLAWQLADSSEVTAHE